MSDLSGVGDGQVLAVGQNGTGKEKTVVTDNENSVSSLNYDIYEKDGKVYCAQVMK